MRIPRLRLPTTRRQTMASSRFLSVCPSIIYRLSCCCVDDDHVTDWRRPPQPLRPANFVWEPCWTPDRRQHSRHSWSLKMKKKKSNREQQIVLAAIIRPNGYLSHTSHLHNHRRHGGQASVRRSIDFIAQQLVFFTLLFFHAVSRWPPSIHQVLITIDPWLCNLDDDWIDPSSQILVRLWYSICQCQSADSHMTMSTCHYGL